MEVIFEENVKDDGFVAETAPVEKKNENPLIDVVLKKGIATTRHQANKILLFLAIIFFLVAITLFLLSPDLKYA